MKIQFAVLSDKGLVRQNNEDAYLADPGLGIFAVADGMGGHASGEVASRTAVETLREFLTREKQDADATLRLAPCPEAASPARRLVQAIRLANFNIYRASQEKVEYQGMGTTLVAAYFPPGGAVAANVGDSRLYRIRGSTIEQWTQDHSLVWEQFKQGLISKEELSAAPYKHVVTRALGIHPNIEVDIHELLLQVKDVLLLCSDGLSDLVKDAEILRVVSETPDNLEGTVRKLIHLANSRGGKDNITALILRIDS